MPQAQLTLSIDAQNKAGKALDRAEKQVAKLRKQLGQTAKQSDKNEKANKRLKRSFKQLEDSTKRAKRGFSTMQTAMGGLLTVFAGGLLVDGIKQGASFQAKLASLGDDVDQTRKRLKQLQEGAQGAFSMDALVSAESKIKAFGLELELTPKLMEVLTAKASRMSVSTEHAVDSFITGLSRQQVQILDNIGITFKASDAYQEFADKNDLVADKLTGSQKAAAFQAKAMEMVMSDTTQANQAFIESQAVTAKLDDAVLALQESLVPLAPALVEAVELLGKGAIFLSDFVSAQLEALGLIDTATEKALKKAGADKAIDEKAIKRTYALLAALGQVQELNLTDLTAEHTKDIDRGLFEKIAKKQIEYFNVLRKNTDSYSKNLVRKILNIQNSLIGDDSFLSQWNGMLLDVPGLGSLMSLFTDDTRESAQLSGIIRTQYDGTKNVLLDMLSIQDMQKKKQQAIKEETEATAKAANAWFNTMVPGKKKKKKPTATTRRPTKAERAIDLDILDLQIMLAGELTAFDRLHIEQQIEQLELQKLRVDRTRDEIGILDRKQQLLDTQHESAINQAEKERRENDYKFQEQIANELRAHDQKVANHKLDLQIADSEIKLAGITDQAQRKKIERQIEDLELMKAKIGADERQLELLEKQIEALEKKREVEDLAEQVPLMEQFANDISMASTNMAQFAPAMATMMQQMEHLSRILADQKSSSEDVAGAVITGVGVTAAAFVDGEKEKATILALMETAQSIKSFAFGNIGGGLAHAAAAAMFAKAAGGAGGGGGAKKRPASAPSAGGGGGGAITVNFGSGIVLGSPQSVGRAVFEATDSVVKTGMTTGAV